MSKQLAVVRISTSDCQAWNDFVASWPDFGLLQSYEWGELKEQQGWQAVRLTVQDQGRIVAGAQMLVKPAARGLVSLAYVPRGPLVDWQDGEVAKLLLDGLHAEARRQRAICLRIEPPLLNDPANHSALESYGFQQIALTNQPRCSSVVDLPPSTDDLLMALPSSTRYNIRKAQRKGVTVEPAGAEALPTFFHLMEVTSGRDDFPIRPFDYYQEEWEAFSRLGQAQLFVSRYQGQIIAAQLPFYYGKHAATFHAGSLNEFRELKAGYLMMWTAMCWAADRGCRTFDLWGIPDEVGELIARGEAIPEGKNGGLWGVYYYKQAFRGRVVYYVGAYDYVYSPALYRTLDLLTLRLGSLDKLAHLGDRLTGA